MFDAATEVRRYADFVTEDVLGAIQEDAAIADNVIKAGETVSLRIEDGLLHARGSDTGRATGTATRDAQPGEDVGVTGFAGIIDLEPGTIELVQVPSIRSGGSRNVPHAALTEACAGAELVVCAGVEAVVAARSADIAVDTWFAPGPVAANAATLGLDVAVIATVDHIGRVTDALRDADVSYGVTDGR